MITGKDLIERGWHQGRAIGLALDAAKKLRASGLDETQILRQLEKVREDPTADAHGALVPLARELGSIRAAEKVRESEKLYGEALPYDVWGEDLIEPNTVAQMEGAMRLPVSVGGALMPDAHLGYGLPVGGVLATEGAVIPWAVGVDIACRMRLSVFELSPELLEDRRDQLADVLLRNTNFGAGSKFKEGRRPEHEVLDDPAWKATPFLRKLKDTDRAQLGTSGSGNHFVEWGVFEALGEPGETSEEEGVREEGAEFALRAGPEVPGAALAFGEPGCGVQDRQPLLEDSQAAAPEARQERRGACLARSFERGG